MRGVASDRKCHGDYRDLVPRRRDLSPLSCLAGMIGTGNRTSEIMSSENPHDAKRSDASDADGVPTLFEWMGGGAALDRLMSVFYERVPDDPLLAPVFAHIPPDHAEHVAAFVAEVLGGPPRYSTEHGGHAAMVRHHLGRALTEEQRNRWMTLLLSCADEVGLPDDPEFRSAFVAYIEWGTRLAVINSQPGVPQPESQPMPRWGWGVPGGPYRAPQST
jgi:hemoglobin